MKYSNDNKEFTAFKVELKTLSELRKEINKITELKEYYQKQIDTATAVNSKYFYDIWEFYAQKKWEFEIVLYNYEQKMIKKGRKNWYN